MQRIHTFLAAFAVLLLVLALALPPVAQMAGYHDFADQRTLLGIPYAMDVLTNAPFALAALAIAVALRGYRQRSHALNHSHNYNNNQAPQPMPLWWYLGAVTAFGFAATTIGSGLYHLDPNDWGVLWDRLAMSIIFAGIIGLSVRQIASDAASALAAALTLAGAFITLPYWYISGNFTPWSVLQGGGMVLMLGIALALHIRPALRSPGAPALALLAVLGWYALCKVCELADHSLFALSGEWISGHSLKHVFAAIAAWPVVRMVQRARPQPQQQSHDQGAPARTTAECADTARRPV